MAYFTKGKTGWRAQVERAGVRLSATFPTKAEAQAWAVAEEAAILAGKRGMYPRKTLTEAIARYRKEVTDKKANGRADGLRFDAWLRDFPELAGKVFHTITTEDLSHWVHARLDRVKPSSVMREVQLFRPVWTRAIDIWRWAGASPWKGLDLPGDAPPRTRQTQWMEARRIVRSGGYSRQVPPQSMQQQTVWAYMVALHTALRSGEILRMARSNVDLKMRVYHLPRHKTDRYVGQRIVPFTPRAARLLAALDAEAARAGRDAYFTVSDGSRDALFRKLRKRVMIEGLNFHDSRAAALTWLSKRYDVMTLAKISGHVDINMLFSTYYRETPQQVASRL